MQKAEGGDGEGGGGAGGCDSLLLASSFSSVPLVTADRNF